MAKQIRNPWMPTRSIRTLSKAQLLQRLSAIDADPTARARVLRMETDLDARLRRFEASFAQRVNFKELGTSPLVLLAHAKAGGVADIAQIEPDLLLSKRWSSLETSIGKMIEEITLPVYGWQTVPSGMQSLYSVIDGEKDELNTVRFLTLKSGYNTINDDSGRNIAEEVIGKYQAWAQDKKVSKVIFTFATLYGTPNMSNKKDWHILRNVYNTLSQTAKVITAPQNIWNSEYNDGTIELMIDVKHGTAYWEYLGQAINADAFIEFAVAYIRTSVLPSPNGAGKINLPDLAAIADTTRVPQEFNVSLLQKSQIPWLFMFASYYCDKLDDFTPLPTPEAVELPLGIS